MSIFAVWIVDCFSFQVCIGEIPTLEPLRFITPDVIGNYAVNSIENALWSTLLPAVRKNMESYQSNRKLLIDIMYSYRTDKMLLQYLLRRACLDLLAVWLRKGSP